MSRAMAGAPGGAFTNETAAVVVTHVHDEADIRMKSFGTEQDESYKLETTLFRGRTSNIQNHVVNLKIGARTFEWLTELQALLRKDGPTIATSIIATVQELATCLTTGLMRNPGQYSSLRFVHVLIGVFFCIKRF